MMNKINWILLSILVIVIIFGVGNKVMLDTTIKCYGEIYEGKQKLGNFILNKIGLQKITLYDSPSHGFVRARFTRICEVVK